MVHVVKTHTETGQSYHLIADRHGDLMMRYGTEFEHYDVIGSDIRNRNGKGYEFFKRKRTIFCLFVKNDRLFGAWNNMGCLSSCFKKRRGFVS